MITVCNRQRKIPIDTQALLQDIQTILRILRYDSFVIGVLLTTNKSIQKYNKLYRNKNKPTDILSFPYHSTIAGKRIRAYTPEDKNLGDIVISLEYIAREARIYNISVYDRLRILLVHGICHLLGYDHDTDHDWRRMRAKEGYILKKLKEARLNT